MMKTLLQSGKIKTLSLKEIKLDHDIYHHSNKNLFTRMLRVYTRRKTSNVQRSITKRREDALLGPVYMGKNTSPARPGADKRGKFQPLFI